MAHESRPGPNRAMADSAGALRIAKSRTPEPPPLSPGEWWNRYLASWPTPLE